MLLPKTSSTPITTCSGQQPVSTPKTAVALRLLDQSLTHNAATTLMAHTRSTTPTRSNAAPTSTSSQIPTLVDFKNQLIP